VRVDADAESCRVCLSAAAGGDVECAEEPVEGPVRDAARRCAALLHDRVLGARVDMSLLDPSALEGSTTRGGSVDDVLTGTAPDLGP
jgi:hypothetical protein